MRFSEVALVCVGALVLAGPGNAKPLSGGEKVMHHATGTFEVKMKPEPLCDVAGKTALGRMSIDKVFHGQLEATSQGEFLSAMGSEKGSAGYVAIEKVTGTLDGRAGSFVLQHSGTMDRGTAALTVTVVPDSGAGELVGLKGTMAIVVEPRKHTYDFEYSL